MLTVVGFLGLVYLTPAVAGGASTAASPGALWHRSFDGPGFETGGALADAGGGSVYVATTSTQVISGPSATTESAIVIRRVSPGGRVVWQRFVRGLGSGPVIASDGLRGLVVAATFVGQAPSELGTLSVSVMRMDQHGDVQWKRIVRAGRLDRPTDVTVGPDAAITVIGASQPRGTLVPTGDARLLVVRLSGEGGVEWTRRFGAGARSLIGSGVAASGGALYLTGTSFPLDYDPTAHRTDGTKIFLAKVSPEGSIVWRAEWTGAAHRFPQARAASARSIIVSAESIVVGGSVGATSDFLPDQDPTDAVLVVFDTEGRHVRHEIFGGNGADEVTEVVASGEGFMFTGSSTRGHREYVGALFGAASATGSVQWLTVLGKDRAVGNAIVVGARQLYVAVVRSPESPTAPKGVVAHAFRSPR